MKATVALNRQDLIKDNADIKLFKLYSRPYFRSFDSNPEQVSQLSRLLAQPPHSHPTPSAYLVLHTFATIFFSKCFLKSVNL